MRLAIPANGWKTRAPAQSFAKGWSSPRDRGDGCYTQAGFETALRQKCTAHDGGSICSGDTSPNLRTLWSRSVRNYIVSTAMD